MRGPESPGQANMAPGDPDDYREISLSAAADWDRGLGHERRPDRFSLWAFVASLAGLVLISVGVGLGLTVGC